MSNEPNTGADDAPKHYDIDDVFPGEGERQRRLREHYGEEQPKQHTALPRGDQAGQSGNSPPASGFVEKALEVNPETALDTITVLRTIGPLATKKWLPDGSIKGYDNAALFTVSTHHINSLFDLARVLQKVEGDPQSLVIRGRLRDDAGETQRANLPAWNAKRAQDGDPPLTPRDGQFARRAVLFEDVAHHWVMLDVDGYRPSIDPVAKPEAAIREFITTSLPAAFHAASFYWQMSSSAGHTKYAGVLKAQVWFWLREPATSPQVKAWAAANALPIDRSVFSAVQAHYAAAPVFADGVADPVARRSGFYDLSLAGDDDVAIVMPEAPVHVPIEYIGAPPELADVKGALDQIDPNTLGYGGEGDIGWIELLFATHSGTGGSDEGLQMFLAWSSRWSHFDEAKSRDHTLANWRSAKLKGGGIGVGTLYKAANAATGWLPPDWRPNIEGLEDLSSEPARVPVVPAVTVDGVERVKAGVRDLRLPVTSFPYTKQRAKGTVVPTNHSANYTVLLQRSGFWLAYDVIEKEIKVTVHGQPLPKSDHEGEVLLRRATDLCVVNNLPIDGLPSTLTALVAGNPVNPVTDVLSSLVWDGKPRFEAIAEAVGPGDLSAARAAFRVFFVQACAAADGGERGMRTNAAALPKYETVLVLQGEQGAGKTSGLRRLLPAPLRGYFQDGVTLAIGDKDSERQAVSAWVSELGELEATFRRSDTERLKAFLSKREDRMRVAYGRADSRFRRRTVFVASANGEKVLTDLTGSRRFAVLSVTTMDLGWSDDEIAQVWAEAWHRYVSGEQWWPTREEEIVLRGAAERFESASSVEERLHEKYDWEQGMAGVRAVQRMSVTQILDLLRPSTAREHSQAEMTQARETIRRLWRRHGAKLKDGELKVRVLDEWTAIYQSGGKNAGFLLPPVRDSGGLAVERDALL